MAISASRRTCPSGSAPAEAIVSSSACFEEERAAIASRRTRTVSSASSLRRGVSRARAICVSRLTVSGDGVNSFALRRSNDSNPRAIPRRRAVGAPPSASSGSEATSSVTSADRDACAVPYGRRPSVQHTDPMTAWSRSPASCLIREAWTATATSGFAPDADWPSASAAAARTDANGDESSGWISLASAGRSRRPSARTACRCTASFGCRVPSRSVWTSASAGARRSSASKMAWRTAWTDAASVRGCPWARTGISASNIALATAAQTRAKVLLV